MTTLLAIDTATEACVAALHHRGRLSYLEHLAPRRHGDYLLADCRRLLSEAGLTPADLDAVAFGRGPGAFTGLRIAAGVAQGLALALDLPVVPVSTLETLAAAAQRRLGARQVLVAMDARMNEVYWNAYRMDEHGLPDPLGAERLSDPDAVRLPHPGPWQCVGSGWAAYGDRLGRATGLEARRARPFWYPNAEDLTRLALHRLARGEVLPAEGAQPVYLRNRVTQPPA